ncbi:DUF2637 domain-containing protein [Streptomyces sp. NPDC087908]|uniref:DUF2637 domain-containing protein n=1 Tax=Streptomyces sp. NPDC087908 TaxID=3365820 RepID=UPI00381BFED2
MAAVQLTRTHKTLIGIVIAGALIIAGIGFAGSYAAVRELAVQKGFGTFSYFFPIGIDAGICVLLALDLLLTWLRIPFPLLRQTAWVLTAATIAFNGAAAWPDPLGVGMHAVIPVLFVVTVEAARHAVGRIADITADRYMEGVRISRWLLSPAPTFKLWRRMKLWELRSYEQAIGMEQDRLIYQVRLQARYGRAWRRKAPVEALVPLRLARIGVPLTQTVSAGLTAAGLSPVLPSRPEPKPVPVEEPELTAAAEVPELPSADQPPLAETRALAPESPPRAMDPALKDRDAVPGPAHVDLTKAGQDFIGRYGVLPSADQFAAFLARDYSRTDQDTAGLPADALLERVLAKLRAADADAAVLAEVQETDAEAAVLPAPLPSAPGPESDAPTAAAPAYEVQPGAGEPHPLLGEQDGVLGLSHPSSEPVQPSVGAVPAPTASATDAGPAAPAGRFVEQSVHSAPAEAEGRNWAAEVSASGEATARVSHQQDQETPIETEPIQREVALVAAWLIEAEEAGRKLSGAEVARRLEVSPKTGQRRVLQAKQHLEVQRRQQGRAHLRSVGSS